MQRTTCIYSSPSDRPSFPHAVSALWPVAFFADHIHIWHNYNHTTQPMMFHMFAMNYGLTSGTIISMYLNNHLETPPSGSRASPGEHNPVLMWDNIIILWRDPSLVGRMVQRKSWRQAGRTNHYNCRRACVNSKVKFIVVLTSRLSSEEIIGLRSGSDVLRGPGTCYTDGFSLIIPN